MARVKAVVTKVSGTYGEDVSTDETETSESSEEEGSLNDPNDATHLWESYEEEVADMVDQLKIHLSQIHPGIGDQITLARFCKFVRLTSSCL